MIITETRIDREVVEHVEVFIVDLEEESPAARVCGHWLSSPTVVSAPLPRFGVSVGLVAVIQLRRVLCGQTLMVLTSGVRPSNRSIKRHPRSRRIAQRSSTVILGFVMSNVGVGDCILIPRNGRPASTPC